MALDGFAGLSIRNAECNALPTPEEISEFSMCDNVGSCGLLCEFPETDILFKEGAFRARSLTEKELLNALLPVDAAALFSLLMLALLSKGVYKTEEADLLSLFPPFSSVSSSKRASFVAELADAGS